MARFEVPVVAVDAVTPHPDADRLALVRIGGYTSIMARLACGGMPLAQGALVAYLPAAAVLKPWLLQRLGLWDAERGQGVSALAGSAHDRVKAIRLRGVFSEGLVLPLEEADGEAGWLRVEHGRVRAVRGENVAEALGVTKYEPPVPTAMAGEVFSLGRAPIGFDLEAIERFPDALAPGELVSMTEKLHGTLTGISVLVGLDHPEAFPCPWGSRDLVVWSKGLGARGLVFKAAAANRDNLYLRAAGGLLGGPLLERGGVKGEGVKGQGVMGEGAAGHDGDAAVRVGAPDGEHPAWRAIAALVKDGAREVHILGETFGQGIQDLHYGEKTAALRLFDIAVRRDGEEGPAGLAGRWLRPGAMRELAARMGAQTVPVLHEGPFDPDAVPGLRDGKTTLGGGHIREGLAIKRDREEPVATRLALKAVSPDYKLRKGGTELS